MFIGSGHFVVPHRPPSIASNVAGKWQTAGVVLTRVFRWNSAAFIASFWGAVPAMIGIGVSHRAFPEAFDLAYFFALCGFVWSEGSWLTSGTLGKRKPKSKKRKPLAVKRYRILKWGVSALISVAFVVAIVTIYEAQETFELSQAGGSLIPASDPRPDSFCNSAIPKDSLVVYIGESAIWLPDESAFSFFTPGTLPVITTSGEVLLGIVRDSKGGISLTAHIRDRDLKVLAEIEDNKFLVNEHDVLSMKRTDRSTLVVRDDYGSTVLNVRYLNPAAVRITGKLYFAVDSYVLLDDRSMTIVRRGNSPQIINGQCISGAGIYVD